MDETFSIIDNLCEDVSPVSCTWYHGTVWSLHQVPQMLKWQPLDILDGVHGYDQDFAGNPEMETSSL